MKKILFYALICLLVIACNNSVQHNNNYVSDLEALQLKTSFVDINDNSLDLLELNKSRLVISYWATWCAPCIKEMPSLKRAEEILKDYGYTFLLVSD